MKIALIDGQQFEVCVSELVEGNDVYAMTLRKLTVDAEKWIPFNHGRYRVEGKTVMYECSAEVADKKEEDIWQAFDRVLEEHGPIEAGETPEEAAEKHCQRYKDHSIDALLYCTDANGEMLSYAIFMTALRWAKQHPEELERWKG